MKRFSRLFPILVSAAALSAGGSSILLGCGSKGSSSNSDGGVSDATVDGPGEDVLGQETGSDADAGPADDTGADGGTSADADAGGGSNADSSLAITVNAATFPSLLATAICNNIAACCGTTGDAATFNWQSCFNSKIATGFNGSNTGATAVDGGHLQFNETQAQICLNTFLAADCVTNQITSTEEVPLYRSCFGAYSGTLPTGAPCSSTIECATGNFCLPVDGGVGDAGAVGLCQPLAGDGGACGVFAAQAAGQTVCSYRGAASNGLFCQNISGDAGITQLSPSQWTCQPQWALGSQCYTNQDCASYLCHQVGSAFQCANAGNWANASTCASFKLDAGGSD